MARKIDRLRTLLFSLAVGGALMFGARTALAAPTADLCPEQAIGRCTNQPNCQMKCDPPFANTGLTGICENGCCFCVE
jgi:hypothetical protein